jgi:hypothetical protein
MKKLTKKNLSELAKTMPVIEESLQMSYVGGGNGHQPTLIPKWNSIVCLVMTTGTVVM